MRKIFHWMASFLIRISAFVTKEFFSVISQPRLLGVLILGPFLILLIFGISYRNIYRTLRVSVVYPQNSEIEDTVRTFSESSISGIEVVNVTSNAAGALQSLGEQQVDLVMIIPDDTLQEIEKNQQAEFSFYHQEIDPVEVAYADIVAHRITQEINQQLLLSAVVRGQVEGTAYRDQLRSLAQVQPSSTGENGQPVLESAAGFDPIGAPQILWLLLQAANNSTDSFGQGNPDNPQEAALGEDNPPGDQPSQFAQADQLLTEFIEINPRVLIEPFQVEINSLNKVVIQPVHFYIPAVLALLLQHVAISLAGLSIVTERFAGTMEIMRAAPVNAFEVLAGKYVSFTLFISVLAAVLTALVHWVLGVPLLGGLNFYALTIFLVILVSLGSGFLISSFADSASQAVQISMVLLLASIFFSGFFLPLYRLWWPAQSVSWMMPATYGLHTLQDIMLRSRQPEAWMLWVLAGMGTALFVVNWLRLRHLMVQR